ncbi:MAG: glycosyltransferase [Phycisphaeraceae bacterium]|nr:MAG: glycosyltransferase [Phycisphaeraceae bacterium]
MRIVHVIRSLNPGHGGPPAVAIRLAAAQAALGHHVSIVSSSDVPRDTITRAAAGVPGLDRLSLILTQGTAGPFDRLLHAGFRSALARALPGASFTHLHGVWDRELIIAADESRSARVPYALTPHGMLDPWSLWGQSRLKALKKSLALRLIFRPMLRRAAFLHALNADEARLMQPLRLGPPVEIIPNGVFREEVDSPPHTPEFAASRPEIGPDGYVLFLSRLHFKKGLDLLVEAFSRIAPARPGISLVIAGPEDGAGRSARDIADRLGLSGRVVFTGPLYGRDKLAALAGAACFCLPSRQEGFSVAIIEAMACRTPVLISDQCHFPEAKDAGAGLIVPCDAEVVASGLEKLLAMPDDQRRAMGERGRDLVLASYVWDRVAERMTRAYELALRPKPEPDRAE